MDLFSSEIIARQVAGGPVMPSTPEEDIEDYGLALLAMLMRAWVRIRILKAFGVYQYIDSILLIRQHADQHHRIG
jgi:hypothetical protein